MFYLQRYPLNFYQINNVEDIVVFLSCVQFWQCFCKQKSGSEFQKQRYLIHSWADKLVWRVLLWIGLATLWYRYDSDLPLYGIVVNRTCHSMVSLWIGLATLWYRCESKMPLYGIVVNRTCHSTVPLWIENATLWYRCESDFSLYEWRVT